MSRILIAEDEPRIASFVAKGLRATGWSPTVVEDGPTAYDYAMSGDFDLLGTYIYKLGTSSQDFGMASAVSILVLAITIALSWFYIRSLLKEDRA